MIIPVLAPERICLAQKQSTSGALKLVGLLMLLENKRKNTMKRSESFSILIGYQTALKSCVQLKRG